MNKYIDFKRLWLAVRRTALLNWKGLIIACGTVGAVQLISAMIAAFSGTTIDWADSLFMPFLYLGGFIAASISFREYSDKDRNLRILTLPISSVERFAEKWVVMTPGFILVTLIFTFAVSLLSQALGRLIFHNAVGIFNPFLKQNWTTIPYFLVIQSIFYLGSAWFRKASFFKTIMSVFVLGIGFSILAVIVLRILFGGWHTSFEELSQMQNLSFGINRSSNAVHPFAGINQDQLVRLGNAFVVIAKILFWTILPASYVISWFSLREKEVKHGI